MIAELLVGLAIGVPAAEPKACAVTRSALPSRRYGVRRLWTFLSADGVLRVQRSPDGSIGVKVVSE